MKPWTWRFSSFTHQQQNRQNIKNKPNDGSFKAPRTLWSAFSGIEKQDESDTMIVSTTNDWYDAKHPVQTIDEIKMINSLAIEECPFCHRRHFHKAGFNKFKIQDWCKLFSFIWNHHGFLPRMVRDMLQLLVSTHDVARYRNAMAKNR